MIEKIQPNVPPGYANNINQAEGRQEVPDAQHRRQVDDPSAEVSLSGDALALQRIMQAANEAPDVRDDVVQAIRDQLEAGTYEINVDSLAERLLPLLR